MQTKLVRALPALLVTFGLCHGSFLSGQAVAQEESAHFLQRDQRHDVVVPLNELGLLLSKQALKDLALTANALSGPGITLTGERSGDVAIVSATPLASRKELVNFYKDLKSQFPNMIETGGFVVRSPATGGFAVVTDEFLVRFAPDVTEAQIEAFHAQHRVEVVERMSPELNLQLVRVTDESGDDTLTVSNRYNESNIVVYAHPNFLRQPDARQSSFIPNDPLFGDQWHLDNTSQGGGTVDADIDADRAWTIEQGDPGILIAVMDGGFDMTHPDLVPNLWTNPNEIPNNNDDDDSNGRVDDIHGWDFVDGDNDPSFESGDDLGGIAHGTVDAGGAAARGNNGIGVSGSCPHCQFVPLRIGTSASDRVNAFFYARSIHADVITASWGCDDAPVTPCLSAVEDAIDLVANTGRGGAGTVVLFAMQNAHTDRCVPGPNYDYSARETVIAVSAVNNHDQILTGPNGWPNAGGGFGECMDVLSPTYGGTLWGATTDMQGSAGYNDSDVLPVCQEPANALDYTFCATGTSFATPVAAGVAGLILSADPTLTRTQVQRLLQDTADKVQNSTGAYRPADGFSAPSGGAATHGYGRINAYEAVRIAAPVADKGLGGVDVFLRDNWLDWGNTEQPSNRLFESPREFIPHWRSVDIKVDAPPFSTAPTNSAMFEAFVHENPLANSINKVYVRVRNRGPATAADVTVKLHWAFAGSGLPALPSDFWTQFPNDSADTSVWHPLGVQNISDLVYSGASVAAKPADEARIVSFDFQAPAFDISLPNPEHYCLFAVIDSPQDPVSDVSQSKFVPDEITPSDNNVTHRNVALRDAPTSGGFNLSFFVSNPYESAIITWLKFDIPKGWRVRPKNFQLSNAFSLEPSAQQLVTVEFVVPEETTHEPATVYQMILDEDDNTLKVLGGLTIEPPRSES
jgi:subtilisin family serine protease